MDARLILYDVIMYPLQTVSAAKNTRAEWEIEVRNCKG